MTRALKLFTLVAMAVSTLSLTAHARISMDQMPTSAGKANQTTSKTLRYKSKKTSATKAAITIEPRRSVGYVMELVVGCPTNNGAKRTSGIITFSALDKTFCQPNRVCHRSAASAAASICKVSSFESTLQFNKR